MYFCVFSIYKGISVILTLAENYEIFASLSFIFHLVFNYSQSIASFIRFFLFYIGLLVFSYIGIQVIFLLGTSSKCYVMI